ncbi:hypothetical protein ACLESO_07395 [Pyxidicoccus sp. 3LG]
MALTTLISLFTGVGLLATVPSSVPRVPPADAVQPRKELRLAQYAPPAARRKPRPPFEVEQSTTAFVIKGQVQGVEWGGFTPLWVHPSLVLQANCEGRLRKVELRGADTKLLRTLEMPADSTLHGTRFDIDLPVWSVKEVVQQCQTGKASLERSLNATLFCQGQREQKHGFVAKLAVSCDAPVPYLVQAKRDLLLRLGPPYDALRVGSSEPLTVGADLTRMIPRPTEAHLVEADADGKVLRRLAPLALPEELRGQELQVPLDTRSARTVRLAVETRFADGSTWVGGVKTQEIITDTARQARSEADGEMQAFEVRFREKFKDRCADLDATMEWLEEQPEIEVASVAEGGHSFYYKVHGALSGMSYSCHRRR